MQIYLQLFQNEKKKLLTGKYLLLVTKSFNTFSFLKEMLSVRSSFKVSVKENEVPTEKNSSRASIFATKASYIGANQPMISHLK